MKNPAASLFQDFELKVDVEHISGIDNKSMAQILFRIADRDNYYEFDVSPAGTFRLLKWVADEQTVLKGWTVHVAINKGPGMNKVTVKAVGSQLTFFRKRTASLSNRRRIL